MKICEKCKTILDKTCPNCGGRLIEIKEWDDTENIELRFCRCVNCSCSFPIEGIEDMEEK